MSDEINTTVEEWKTIEEFPNYDVSNLARVRVKSTGKILKPQHQQAGYVIYYLRYFGVRGTRLISRLVAQAFLEHDPDPARNEINHKNGIKEDNLPSNLEWATRAENVRHSYEVLGRQVPVGEDRPNAKLTVDGVILIRQLISEGTPLSAIACCFNVSQRAIRSIKDGDNWRHVT